MKKTIVFLLLVIFIGNLLFSFSVSAGDFTGYSGKEIHYQGLVPCGKSEAAPASGDEKAESEEVTERCEFCHLFVMLDGIIDFVLLDILPWVVILMILIAGIMFYFAGGNPSLLLQAKKLITSVVIGVTIILCAYLIIGTVLTVLGVQSWTTLDQWAGNGVFNIICPIGENGGIVTPTPTPTPSGYTTVTVSTNPDELYQQTVTSSCEVGQTRVGDGICTAISVTTIVTKNESYGVNGWLCEFTDASEPAGNVVPVGKLIIKCTETPGPSLGQTEAINKLKELGVEVYKPCPNEDCNDSVAECGGTDNTYVCLNGLPNSIIEKLGQIKEACNCDVLITGGTETFGHDDNTPHGYGEAVVDLEDSSGLENWLKDNSYEDGPSWCPDYGTGYELNDGSAEFCDEGSHFHFELK